MLLKPAWLVLVTAAATIPKGFLASGRYSEEFLIFIKDSDCRYVSRVTVDPGDKQFCCHASLCALGASSDRVSVPVSPSFR